MPRWEDEPVDFKLGHYQPATSVGAQPELMVYSSRIERLFAHLMCAQTLLARTVTPPGRVAQLAEHSALNRQVVGSIPTASTTP